MFQQRDWQRTYETGQDDLFEEFYRPFLQGTTRYDRVAGYLSLRGLASALEGVDSMLETDGQIRVIAGADLREQEKGILFPDQDEVFPKWVESQLTIIAELLDRGNLTIKIADIEQTTGVFHSKLGIGEDENENVLSFEGSVNETPSGWLRNYERFKVHRSWEPVEERYVDRDEETFRTLWNDEHPYVDVYDLDEAEKKELIDWKTDVDEDLEPHIETVRRGRPADVPSEWELSEIVSTAGQTPGGIHLAEDISTISPWPHQRTISDTAVSLYPNNLFFCDEVGLGKTIEVGLTLSRLIHTGKVETALLLVPASLVRQWQNEMYERFNIMGYYFDRRGHRDVLVGPLGDESEQVHELHGNRTAETWEHTPIGNFVSNRDQPTVIIQSWHRARLTNNQHHVAPDQDDDVWDLTIVDEAHNARGSHTKFYELLTRVEQVSTCLYALTATPMQLDIGELYDLLRLSNLPKSWDNQESFREFYRTQMILREALEAVGEEPTGFGALYNDTERAFQRRYEDTFDESLSTEEVKQRLRMFARMISDHAASYPGYDEHIEAITNPTSSGPSLNLNDRTNIEKLFDPEKRTFNNPGDLLYECSKEGWEAIVELSSEMNPVQSRVFRNTRSVLREAREEGRLDETVPRRDVTTEEIDLDEEMRDLFEEVEEYITKTYQLSEEVLKDKERTAIGFVMTTYRQRLSSGLYSITESLKRRRERLDGEVDGQSAELERLAGSSDVSETDIEALLGTEQIDAYQPTESEVVQLEKTEIDSFIDDLERVQSDPKGEQLNKDITALREKGDDKIVIFTQYTDTLDYIAEKLTPIHSVGTYSGDGAKLYKSGSWKNVGKETVKNEFAEDGIGILVCTDSASEGLNLQTGDVLINYDLPWNPMKVEQRIGRIDRIGQENEVVKIINYAYEDGIDKEIYERLDDRLSLFDDVVGDTRPVLTGVESEISELALEGGDQTDIEDLVDEKEREAAEMKSKVEATGLSADDRQTFDDSSLSGWGDQTHPALVSLGSAERIYEPAINEGVIEYLFTQSQILEEAGWSFTALRNHERKDDYPDAVHDAYLLTVPEETTDSLIAAPSEDATAQDSLRKHDSIVVTFSPELAHEFPSLRLLLPGDPLFSHLSEIIQSEGESLKQDISFVTLPQDSRGPVEIEDLDSIDAEVVAPVVREGDVDSISLNVYSEQSARSVLKRWGETPTRN
jgi:superfamily II DNA or RNA helicase